MKTPKNYNFSLSRRNFLWAALACPFLINQILFNDRNEEINPLAVNKDDDFIILAGWVLLNDDLNKNMG
jgi:hypothetical protein